MGRRRERFEKWDQWLLLPVLAFVALYLITQFPGEMMWLLLGAVAFLAGLFVFNKGRKSTVNLKTDITFIAFAFVLILGCLYGFAATGSWMFIVLVILAAVVIAQLYR